MIYLDHNATTPVHPRLLSAMAPYLRRHFGNASSFYRIGRESKIALENSRSVVATCIGADAGEIVFTGGGTESDNLAIRGVAHALKAKGNHIITSSIEHHAVLKTVQALERNGFNVTFVPVNSNCMIDPYDVKKSITPQTILISIMYASNETGVIQPVKEIGAFARERDVVFHTDAVQAVGKIPVCVNEINADLMSVSAHKIYGPKGIGALYVRKGTPITPVLTGGHHEHNLRAGTENVAGIVGLAEALRLATDSLGEESKRISSLRDSLEKGVEDKIKGICVNGCNAPRVPNTTNISFMSIEAESVLLHLDAKDICASSGSACTTGSAEQSHVLMAMGLSQRDAQSAIRFSLGKENTKEDIDITVEALVEITEKLRSISSLKAV